MAILLLLLLLLLFYPFIPWSVLYAYAIISNTRDPVSELNGFD